MDSPGAGCGRTGDEPVTRAALRAGAVLSGLLLASALSFAQTAEKLEAEAKRAFDSGRFKEAAEKYARAADSAEVPADRKGDLYLNSAWAFYIAGSSKSARGPSRRWPRSRSLIADGREGGERDRGEQATQPHRRRARGFPQCPSRAGP
jgi:hypothetical protein